MSDFKPNHICKNPECRKEYYACNLCSRTLSWRSVACSPECYKKYTDLVIAERSKGKTIEIKPERTDMNESQVDELLKKPLDEVLEETKEELKDFADIDGNVNIADAVEEINEILISQKTSTRSRKKK